MKKFLKTLLMLTCVFGLTACGQEEAVSTNQQIKTANAETLALYVVDYVQVLMDNGAAQQWTADYNNIELGDVFADYFVDGIAQSNPGAEIAFESEGKAVRNAVSSFESGLEEIGSIRSDSSAVTSVVDDDTIIVTVPVTGEKGNGAVEVIFSNDMYYTMSSCTLNLDKTVGQLIGRGALNTLIGMGTVFVVLILISLIISCFGVIPKIQDKLTKKPQPQAQPAPTPVQTVVEEEEELADDEELVAVIAAAIAAYEGNASTEGFQVRSIKRAATRKWQKA